jgi:large subunit ribosomal protein L17e
VLDDLFQFTNSGISGRWPEKSIKFITRLLKNAESNADAKNIELEELYIKNIVVEQAPVRNVIAAYRR